MGFLKTVLLICLALVFVLIGIANMTPVTVNLLPPEIGLREAVVRDVPLSAALLGAGMVGVIAGQVMEWLRESRHRREIRDKTVEMGRMRREINRLAARVEADEVLRTGRRPQPR